VIHAHVVERLDSTNKPPFSLSCPSPCPHHDSAPSTLHSLICTGAESNHPVHCPRQLPAWLCGPMPPETRSFFCHFGGFFLDMSHCRVFSHRLILLLRIFPATFFTINPHLDHSYNQKPQISLYQNSNLAPLANVGIGRFFKRFLSVFQEESVST